MSDIPSLLLQPPLKLFLVVDLFLAKDSENQSSSGFLACQIFLLALQYGYLYPSQIKSATYILVVKFNTIVMAAEL